MTNIQQIINRCHDVLIKWQDCQPSIEMAQDFAAVFDLEMNFQLLPKQMGDDVEKGFEPAPDYHRQQMENEMRAKMFDETMGVEPRFSDDFDLAPKRTKITMEEILKQNGF